MSAAAKAKRGRPANKIAAWQTWALAELTRGLVELGAEVKYASEVAVRFMSGVKVGGRLIGGHDTVNPAQWDIAPSTVRNCYYRLLRREEPPIKVGDGMVQSAARALGKCPEVVALLRKMEENSKRLDAARRDALRELEERRK